MQEINRHEFDIAIIGMACRFPGADSVDRFWHNLSNGVEALTVFTEEELLAAGVAEATLRTLGYVKTRGTLSAIDLFDANFFGYNPREAETLDPQQRLFLECAWEAFENANCDVQTCPGRVGVFAGSGMSAYLLTNLYQAYGPAALNSRPLLIGNDKDYLPARVSYKLNLRGPAISVNTACSTSLVAVHLACQSLLHGECDIALAGGASIAATQKQGYLAEEGGVHSPTGRCKTFDAGADGFVPADGVGAVILKRLDDAIADRDCIHAVIKGSAVTNDGAAKVGFTTPSAEGQAEAVIEALAIAGCRAETIGYVEAHGTATDLGDSIEVAALSQAFQAETSRKGFCALGSVKTNIGHTGAACGIAGLIKTVLALQHKQLPPSLHFERPNPHIDFANSPFYVNTRLSRWEDDAAPRRAGVHSFGIGGTNAHVILEEAPQLQPARGAAERPAHLLVLSARTTSALDTLSRSLADHLRTHPELALADVAYTLQVGRASLHYRRAVVGRTRDEVIQALEKPAHERAAGRAEPAKERSVIFVFPDSAPYIGMGYDLYRREAVYRQHIDECVHIIRATLGTDLRDILYSSGEKRHDALSLLHKKSIALPALFMTEYALARLWLSWGVRPQAMIGHGAGEYVAACLAGTMSLADALKLVLLSVQLSEESAALATRHAVATTGSVHPTASASLLEKAKTYIDKMTFSAPHTAFISNVTNTWITPEQAASSSYWISHVRRAEHTVGPLDHFITEQEVSLFLEIGPATGQKGSSVSAQQPFLPLTLSSLPDQHEQADEVASLLTTAGALWCAGVALDWHAFHAGTSPRRVVLPTYPFERQRYWIEPGQVVMSLPGVNGHDSASSPADQPAIQLASNGHDHPGVDGETAAASPHMYPRPDLENPYVAPRNEIEQYIASIYQELLGIEQIGIHDDFFEFGGGDSLIATRVITRLNQAFQIQVSLRDIFEMPTIAELAQAIEKEIVHD